MLFSHPPNITKSSSLVTHAECHRRGTVVRSFTLLQVLLATLIIQASSNKTDNKIVTIQTSLVATSHVCSDKVQSEHLDTHYMTTVTITLYTIAQCVWHAKYVHAYADACT